MESILDPISGFCNPQKGLPSRYISAMTGKKPPKCSGTVKQVFAENVKTLMAEIFERSPNRPKALAQKAGVSLSSVQRAISGETAPNLDTVEAIAEALRIEPFKLLIKSHRDSGDHRNPILRTGT